MGELATCSFLMAPIDAVLAFLGQYRKQRQLQTQRQLAVHGLVDAVLAPDSEIDASGAGWQRLAVLRRITAAVSRLGWFVNPLTSSCLVEGGFERAWQWVPE